MLFSYVEAIICARKRESAGVSVRKYIFLRKDCKKYSPARNNSIPVFGFLRYPSVNKSERLPGTRETAAQNKYATLKEDTFMKKISRRSFLTAAAACGAAAALTACGGSSASSTAAPSTAGSTAASAAAGPVTLQWSVWDKESTPYWQAMVDGYMASHKDVTIEMVDLGSSDYMTVLATQLAGSADLDIVTIKDIPGYANLINLDYLKPLNEVLTRDTGDFNGSIEQLTTDDGNFNAVAFRSDFWVVYYNKDLFDKAGVEYPSNDMTLEDYDALARKMTSGSGDTKVYGCHYHTWRSAASLLPMRTTGTYNSAR